MFSFIIGKEVFESCGSNGCYRTGSLLEGREYIRLKSAGHELRSTHRVSRFEFEHRQMHIGHVILDFVHIDCGRHFEVDQVHELGFYSFKMPLDGQCQYRIGDRHYTARPGQIFASNPFEPIRKRFRGPYTQAIVRIDRSRLEEQVSEELGHRLAGPVRFEPTPRSGPAAQLATGLIEMLWKDGAVASASRHWRVERHLERALLITMLCGVPNNYSQQVDECRKPAPFYVRKAEDFIRAHLERTIAIEDVAAAAGVSPRSLYYGFRRWRQTTPRAYLKQVRLEKARQELLVAALEGGTVTDIALRVGYAHPSHFACDYKTRFGEKPSDTLLGCRLSTPY